MVAFRKEDIDMYCVNIFRGLLEFAVGEIWGTEIKRGTAESQGGLLRTRLVITHVQLSSGWLDSLLLVRTGFSTVRTMPDTTM